MSDVETACRSDAYGFGSKNDEAGFGPVRLSQYLLSMYGQGPMNWSTTRQHQGVHRTCIPGALCYQETQRATYPSSDLAVTTGIVPWMYEALCSRTVVMNSRHCRACIQSARLDAEALGNLVRQCCSTRLVSLSIARGTAGRSDMSAEDAVL